MQIFIFACTLVVYFVIHSILAAHSVKNMLIDKFIGKKYYRLLFNAVAVISLLPIMYAFEEIASPYLFDLSTASAIGLGLVAVGILLLLYALSQYNLSEFSGIQQLKTQAAPYSVALKTSGFNAVVRHPLYFAGLIIIWGGFLYSPTIKMLVASVIASLYLYFGTKLEEQKLILEFGEEYKTYQKKVGMLVPFVK